jgi:hypothetical protein
MIMSHARTRLELAPNLTMLDEHSEARFRKPAE